MRYLICSILLVSAAEVHGAEFCAVTVNIVNPDNTPARLTRAQFVGPDGKVILDDLIEGPTLRICDFGFGDHKLILGSDNCYPVTFERLRLRLDDPIELVARLNTCSRAHFLASLCPVYLRIRTSDGAPIEGAKLTWTAASAGGVSDSMGRLAALLVPGHSPTATVSKDGYSPVTFGISCDAPHRIEMPVTLVVGQRQK